ncbi:hypothetical protein N9381_14970, partial [Paracoccaceae bacterium]|nr:hypothetical protein [Paracoccaceae bacterium]
MGGKREKPEDIVMKLRQVEVLQGQGKPFGPVALWCRPKCELRRCSRTLGYFTPAHERGTKWDNIEEHIPTISRQAPLNGF